MTKKIAAKKASKTKKASTSTRPHITGLTPEESKAHHDRADKENAARAVVARAVAAYDALSQQPISELPEFLTEQDADLVRCLGLLTCVLRDDVGPDDLSVDEVIEALTKMRQRLRYSICNTLRYAGVIAEDAKVPS